MLDVTRFADLGKFRNEWLNANYHFSFAGYRDPRRRGFGPLLVWNDDTIEPRTGFDPHPHREMEILTYVRSGAITHKDSLGNQGRTEAGDVQVMSAGTGIVHAEYNLEDEPTTLFQIWVRPQHADLAPRWAAAKFPKADRAGRLVALASGEAGVDALAIDQDATLYGATLLAGGELTHVLRPGRGAYLVAATGRLEVNGAAAAARDGIAIRDVEAIRVEALDDAELLLLDLPLA